MDRSLPGWRWAPGCWWCPTMAGCCSAEDTGTAASVSPNWERASWWAESAGTSVRTSGRVHAGSLSQHGSFVLLYLSHRCSYVLGSGSLWHLPHLWIKGHVLYRVEGSPAGKHRLTSISRHLARTLCHQSHRFIDRQGGFSSGLSPRPVQVLCGHDQEVTCVAISTELDMALSGSKVRSPSFQNMKYPQGPLEIFILVANAAHFWLISY